MIHAVNWPSPAARRALAHVAFVLVLGLILYGGLYPRPMVPVTFNQEDKLYHALGFVALAVTMRLAFPRAPWWSLVCWALGIGVGIDLVQTLEPTRDGSIWDVLFDALGIGVGWLVLRLPVLRRWRTP